MDQKPKKTPDIELVFFISGAILCCLSFGAQLNLFLSEMSSEVVANRKILFNPVAVFVTVVFWTLSLRSWKLIVDGLSGSQEKLKPATSFILGAGLKLIAIAATVQIFLARETATAETFGLFTALYFLINSLAIGLYSNNYK